MPAIVYFTDAKAAAFASTPNDKDIDKLLQEINQRSKTRWLVRTETITDKRIFSKDRVFTIYSLYADVNNGEYQLTSFSGNNTKDALINYMLGMLTGMDQDKK